MINFHSHGESFNHQQFRVDLDSFSAKGTINLKLCTFTFNILNTYLALASELIFKKPVFCWVTMADDNAETFYRFYIQR